MPAKWAITKTFSAVSFNSTNTIWHASSSHGLRAFPLFLDSGIGCLQTAFLVKPEPPSARNPMKNPSSNPLGRRFALC